MNSISGMVIQGQKYGRKIGYRTANLLQDNLCVEYGVWVTKVLYDNNWYDSISYFSINSKNEKIFESHLFYFDKYIYGEKIEVLLIQFLREPFDFDSEELLIKQMIKDCSLALDIHNNFSLGL